MMEERFTDMPQAPILPWLRALNLLSASSYFKYLEGQLTVHVVRLEKAL